MKFDTILFDLDGTLTDPAEGITNSVAYALCKMGITPPNKNELLKFIGPPLAESFEKYYNLSRTDSFKAVDLYREYFAPKGIFENRVYDGIPQMLETLKKSGKTLALATSKPVVFAKKILEHFDLEKYFDFVVGSNLDGTLTNKAEVVAVVLEQIKNVNLVNTTMVGDRCHDIIGSVKNNVTPVGVSFGYGSVEELKNAGAVYIASSVKELTEFLMQ